jgi:6-phosphofructokinase 1
MATIKRIAVLTSGGDAPGMNAAVRAVVRSAAHYNIEVFAAYRGYQGLIENDITAFDARSVSQILQRGGTVIKTARSKEFMTKEGRQKAFDNLKQNDIDALVVIGGDGTFTGANILFKEFNFPIIGLPGTIDNDLFGTDYTIGFDTATNTVIEAVDKIRDTALSHNRLFFIEVMGRDAGFIAVTAGLASGALAIVVPEQEMTVEELSNRIIKAKDNKKTASIVIVAEGGKNGNAEELSKKVLAHLPDYEARVTILGHIQRGGSPSTFDRNLASRLGVAAVEGLLAGKKDCMVGMINNKIIHTAFEIAISDKLKMDLDLLRVADILST